MSRVAGSLLVVARYFVWPGVAVGGAVVAMGLVVGVARAGEAGVREEVGCVCCAVVGWVALACGLLNE